MIVRILGEGQYELPADRLAELNELDSALERALDSGDQAQFEQALAKLLGRVREVGKPEPDDALESSDVVLPFADASPQEVRDLLTAEGLIPG